MGFHLIKGTFHVVGYSPDGDSLRFKALDEAKWNLLGPGPLQINSQKHVQLRLQGIDTLETHFFAPGGEVHQPLTPANAATNFLLTGLNITGVVWDAAHRKVIQANDGTAGYLLTREKDEKGGRPICFVFAGTTPESDGSNVFLDVNRMKESLNHKALKAGHAYPAFYFGLFADLREGMTAAVTVARAEGSGLYPLDKTNSGVTLATMAAITDTHPIFPKLFRRLAEFIAGNDPPDLSGFLSWLAARDPKPMLILSSQHFTHFDNVVVVNGQQVRMTEAPENLVFNP